jgi:hypothetical protein
MFGERDRFIAPQQRGGGPGRRAARLAPHFRSEMCLAGRQTPRARRTRSQPISLPS